MSALGKHSRDDDDDELDKSVTCKFNCQFLLEFEWLRACKDEHFKFDNTSNLLSATTTRTTVNGCV